MVYYSASMNGQSSVPSALSLCILMCSNMFSTKKRGRWSHFYFQWSFHLWFAESPTLLPGPVDFRNMAPAGQTPQQHSPVEQRDAVHQRLISGVLSGQPYFSESGSVMGLFWYNLVHETPFNLII